jgi:hypothetical protein
VKSWRSMSHPRSMISICSIDFDGRTNGNARCAGWSSATAITAGIADACLVPGNARGPWTTSFRSLAGVHGGRRIFGWRAHDATHSRVRISARTSSPPSACVVVVWWSKTNWTSKRAGEQRGGCFTIRPSPCTAHGSGRARPADSPGLGPRRARRAWSAFTTRAAASNPGSASAAV